MHELKWPPFIPNDTELKYKTDTEKKVKSNKINNTHAELMSKFTVYFRAHLSLSTSIFVYIFLFVILFPFLWHDTFQILRCAIKVVSLSLLFLLLLLYIFVVVFRPKPYEYETHRQRNNKIRAFHWALEQGRQLTSNVHKFSFIWCISIVANPKDFHSISSRGRVKHGILRIS